MAGVTYRIAVGSYLPSNEGNFALEIREGPPANDNLASAETLAGPLPIARHESTVDATREMDDRAPASGNDR